jgi:glutathione synthase/RimK-type ligase-like ATP-grasp enzyme
VALATCAEWPVLDGDGPALIAALGAAGVDAVPAGWDAPADWAAYDLVVVRSTWDYMLRREEFLAWAASVPRLANPTPTLVWNTDKRYLGELAAAGVPVVPTTFVAPDEAYVAPEYEHVVKPTVSAGAADTVRFAAGRDSSAHAAALSAVGREVMVQPYQSRIDAAGETALLYFGGQFSHAARKGPVLAPGAGPAHEVAIAACTPTSAERAVAEQVLACAPGRLLYARVDLAPGADGEPVLMELELTEPALFLSTSAGSADRFAAAVVSYL